MQEQSTTRTERGGSEPKWFGFLLLQASLIAVLASVVGARVNQLELQSELPPLREEPLTVPPKYDNPQLVTDEQLRSVLRKLVPRFRGNETKINHVDHALRFWGMEAKFTSPDLLSGPDMRRLIVDHGRFNEVYGDEKDPLLIDAPDGIRVRVQEGNGSSSHVDHTMATLAEVGTAPSFPILTSTRATNFGDMVRQALLDFSVNQIEYEWSVLTYALLLPPHRAWTTTEGQQIDFDLLADRIMRQDMPQGVCFGNHRLYALAILLRIDDMDFPEPILSPAARQRILDYLSEMTRRLVAHQHYNGYWDAQWPDGPPLEGSTDEEVDLVSQRILATGHALEWWGTAPKEVHPPRDVMVKAGQWLVRTIDELTEEKVTEYYTFLSHAGRALALWRGKRPSQVDLGQPAL